MDLKDELDRKVMQLFAEGKSTNQVAKLLFNNNWTRASKLRKLFDEASVEALKQVNDDVEVSEDLDRAEPDGEEPDAWELSLRVPVSKATEIFATFTTQEQMDAIATVLQGRMDAALGGE